MPAVPRRCTPVTLTERWFVAPVSINVTSPSATACGNLTAKGGPHEHCAEPGVLAGDAPRAGVVTHPDYGTDVWTALIEARRLPCTMHPKGCNGIREVQAKAPWHGVMDVPCEAPRYCWCGEIAKGGEHDMCWSRRYAVAWCVAGLQQWLAPVNEAWLRKRFRPGADTAVRFGPRGARDVRLAARQEAWRELA